MDIDAGVARFGVAVPLASFEELALKHRAVRSIVVEAQVISWDEVKRRIRSRLE